MSLGCFYITTLFLYFVQFFLNALSELQDFCIVFCVYNVSAYLFCKIQLRLSEHVKRLYQFRACLVIIFYLDILRHPHPFLLLPVVVRVSLRLIMVTLARPGVLLHSVFLAFFLLLLGYLLSQRLYAKYRHVAAVSHCGCRRDRVACGYLSAI